MGKSSLAAIALLLGAVLAHAGPLHKAAGAGDVEEVRRLLAEGEDIGEVQAARDTAALGGDEGATGGSGSSRCRGRQGRRAGGSVALHASAYGRARRQQRCGRLSAGQRRGDRCPERQGRHAAASGREHRTHRGCGDPHRLRRRSERTEQCSIIHRSFYAGEASHFDIVDLLIAHGVSAPPVDPIVGLLADTDPEKGRVLFLGCTRCHTIAQNDRHRSGAESVGCAGTGKGERGRV